MLNSKVGGRRKRRCCEPESLREASISVAVAAAAAAAPGVNRWRSTPPPLDHRKVSVHRPLGLVARPKGAELCRQPLVGVCSKSGADWSGGRDLAALRGPPPWEKGRSQKSAGPLRTGSGSEKESPEGLASVKFTSALFSPQAKYHFFH